MTGRAHAGKKAYVNDSRAGCCEAVVRQPFAEALHAILDKRCLRKKFKEVLPALAMGYELSAVLCFLGVLIYAPF